MKQRLREGETPIFHGDFSVAVEREREKETVE